MTSIGIYAKVAKEKGKIDILVASSGFVEHQKLGEITTSHFDKTFGINARGLLFTVQKALPLLRDGGSIILISSILGFKGLPAHSTYSASKAAVRLLRSHVDGGTQGPRHPCQRD